MNDAGQADVIPIAEVKIEGRVQKYCVLFNERGIAGVGLAADPSGSPALSRFLIPWAEIRGVKRKCGCISWSQYVERSSGEIPEIIVGYEEKPASFFGRLETRFSARTAFQSDSLAILKVLTGLLVMIVLVGASGWWAYQYAVDFEAKGWRGRAHWIIAAFGANGVLVVFSIALLSIVVLAAHTLARQVKSK